MPHSILSFEISDALATFHELHESDRFDWCHLLSSPMNRKKVAFFCSSVKRHPKKLILSLFPRLILSSRNPNVFLNNLIWMQVSKGQFGFMCKCVCSFVKFPTSLAKKGAFLKEIGLNGNRNDREFRKKIPPIQIVYIFKRHEGCIQWAFNGTDISKKNLLIV